MRPLICLVLLLAVSATTADAQRRRDRHHDHGDRWHRDAGPVEFGVRGGYDFQDDVASAGTQLRIPLVRQLRLVPSGDVFFDDAPTEWQINVDLQVQPDAFGGLYGGAGAAFVNRDFDLDADEDTEAGYNLFLGIDGGPLLDARVRPFAEARWTDVEDYSPFRLLLGINVPVR